MRSWHTIGLIVALALIAGLPNLPRTMHGDQVFTLLGAESVSRGELPYRDFWDIRQPGLIGIYWLAGESLGFDEIGLHLFDLLFWSAFAVFVSITWPRMMGRNDLTVWPAIATAGWYWAVTGSVQQMQPEAMVGPLLYIHLYLLMRTSRWSWAVAGVLAATVLSLKLMFLPLLGLVWLFALWRLKKQLGWQPSVLRTGLDFATCILAITVALLPWIVAGELHELRRTFFETPRQMLKELPAPSPGRLASAATWFCTRYGPMIVLAIVGIIRLWRNGKRDWVIFLLAWMICSLGVIVAQRFSWWSYHFMLLALPIGLLTVEGFQYLASRERGLRIFLIVLVLSPAILAIVLKWIPIARHGFCLTSAQRESLFLEEATYRQAHEETAFLRQAGSRSGPIFVAGEPIYYRLAGRTQATSIHGWSLELYPVETRVLLAKQLNEAKPSYIFIDRIYFAEMIDDRYPEIAVLLKEEYSTLRLSPIGTWYERN